jgi:hypothetical protein
MGGAHQVRIATFATKFALFPLKIRERCFVFQESLISCFVELLILESAVAISTTFDADALAAVA